MIVVLALVGCVWISNDDLVERRDVDGDGVDDVRWGGDDCKDEIAAIHPGAAELCNEIDDDCDEAIDDEDDDVVATDWHPDEDHDGFGDADVTVVACDQPFGLIDDDSDCADDDASTHPGVDEHCDGVDEDCDGAVDDGATDAATFYADADDDGHGDLTSPALACEASDGFVASSDDCKDDDPDVYPGAVEACDGTVDLNCDGSTGNVDGDADGFVACNDCDDGDAAQKPGGTEICNAEDDDCDSLVDDDDTGVLGGTLAWPDGDGDGYGDELDAGTAFCARPPDFLVDHTDCDDSRARVHPDRLDPCGDGRDDDCDGTVDDCELPLVQADVTLEGVADADRAGAALACGDVDGVPGDDLVIGAAASGTGGTGAGAVYLVDGPPTSGVLTGADAVWLGDKSFALGTSLALFDTDASGLLDVAIGGAGRAYVLIDPDASNKIASADAAIAGSSSLGAAIAGGNADGDASADLAVSAPLADDGLGLRAGFTYVFAGPVRGAPTLSSARARISGNALDARAGAHIKWIDGDGDGLDELLVSRSTNLVSNIGEVLAYEDPRGNLAPSAATYAIRGSANGDNVGTALVGGDFNGDGTTDLAIGADAANGTGRVFVWFGPRTTTVDLASASARLDGVASSRAGAAVASVPDLDGDDRDELWVGGPGAGTAWFLYGSQIAGTRALTSAAIRATATGAEAGAALIACDIDADDVADVAIGAPARDAATGAVFLVNGRGL